LARLVLTLNKFLWLKFKFLQDHLFTPPPSRCSHTGTHQRCRAGEVVVVVRQVTASGPCDGSEAQRSRQRCEVQLERWGGGAGAEHGNDDTAEIMAGVERSVTGVEAGGTLAVRRERRA
jgi:hypothetical protein